MDFQCTPFQPLYHHLPVNTTAPSAVLLYSAVIPDPFCSLILLTLARQKLTVMSGSTGRASSEDQSEIQSLEKQDTHLTRAATRRTLERHETRPTQGPSDVLDLPYGILSDEANMEEFTEETAAGIIPKRTISRLTGHVEDHELVTFTINDPENPKNWTKAMKW